MPHHCQTGSCATQSPTPLAPSSSYLVVVVACVVLPVTQVFVASCYRGHRKDLLFTFASACEDRGEFFDK